MRYAAIWYRDPDDELGERYFSKPAVLLVRDTKRLDKAKHKYFDTHKKNRPRDTFSAALPFIGSHYLPGDVEDGKSRLGKILPGDAREHEPSS